MIYICTYIYNNVEFKTIYTLCRTYHKLQDQYSMTYHNILICSVFCLITLTICLVLVCQTDALPSWQDKHLGAGPNPTRRTQQTDINQKSVSRACLLFRKCMRKTMENTTDRVATMRKISHGGPSVCCQVERVGGNWKNLLVRANVEQLKWH